MEAQILYIMPVVFLVLIVFSAFFAMSEVAFVSLNKLRLRHLLQQKRKNAKTVDRIVKNMDKLITTILIGNNFVNIALSAIGTAIFIYLFGNSFRSVTLATALITLLVLLFGEITPKIFAVKHSETLSLRLAWAMDIIIRILDPIVKIFLKISNEFLKLIGQTPAKRSPLITEEEIRLMIELGKEEGVLTDRERSMLHRIFEFGDTLVQEVMVPAEDIIAVDINSTSDELLDVIVEQGHSRIPVFEGDIGNIVGVIYARELLNVWRNKELIIIQDLLHRPYFVNSQKKTSELLREFQKIHVYMAVIVDEQKQTLGLVTLEDLLEEIVGEIEGDVS